MEAQSGAAWRGLVDSASLGLSDQLHAAAAGAINKSRGGKFVDGYQKQSAIERARDAHDERRYGVARTVGQVAGAFVAPPVARGAVMAGRAGVGVGRTLAAAKGMQTVRAAGSATVKGKAASVGAKAGASAKVQRRAGGKTNAAKLKPASGKGIDRPREVFGTTLSATEQLKLMALGAGINAQAMLSSDPAATVQDIGAAVLGGALQATRLPSFEAARGVGNIIHRAKLAPTAAAAGAAFAESIAADAFNGRKLSLARAKEAATATIIGQRIGERAMRTRTHALSSDEKKVFGEALGGYRTRLNGFAVDTRQTPDFLANGRHWIPDHRFPGGNVEAKFGFSATLSGPQRRARAQQRIARIDQFTPNHMGRVGGIVGGIGVNQGVRRTLDDEEW